MLVLSLITSFMKLIQNYKKNKKERNQDINVKDMGDYRKIKKQLEQKEQKLTKANNQTKQLDNYNNNYSSICINFCIKILVFY